MFSLALPALLFSIGCGLALAGADYFRKVTPLSVPTPTVLFYFLLGQLPVMGASLFLSEAAIPPLSGLGAAYWIPASCDVAASLAGNALFIVAVRRSALSMIIPLMALIPILTLAMGAAILHEAPTPPQIAGVMLTAGGVFVLYLPQHAAFSLRTVWRNFRAERGALPMVGVACAWALTAPLDKLAIAAAGVGLHGLIQVTLLWLCVCAWMVLAARNTGALVVPTAARAPIFGAAMTAGVSYAFQLAAYSLTLVAFAESIKRVVEIGAALAVGAIVFREPVTRTKLAGIGLVALGIPLMLLPASS